MSRWPLILFAMFCVLGAVACEDKSTVELDTAADTKTATAKPTDVAKTDVK